MAKSKKKKRALQTNIKFEIYGILIIIFSVISLNREGHLARPLSYLFRFLIGNWDWMIPIVFIYIGLYAMIKREWPELRTIRKLGLLLIFLGLIFKNQMSLIQLMKPDGAYNASYIISKSWTTLTNDLFPTQSGANFLTQNAGGGIVGALLYGAVFFLFDDLGASFIKYSLFAIGFLLITGFSFVDLLSKAKPKFKWINDLYTRFSTVRGQSRSKRSHETNQNPAVKNIQINELDEMDEENYHLTQSKANVKRKPSFFQLFNTKPSGEYSENDDENQSFEKPIVEQVSTVETVTDIENPIPIIRNFDDHKEEPIAAKAVLTDLPILDPFQKPKSDSTPYHLPSFHLLAKAFGKNSEHLDFKANARKLEATLESFGVKAKVLEVVRGPAVTRYEIQPDVGVKVSRIVNLTDDIALALAAKDIRMEAPIPGKAAIGIEVPNAEVSIVTMREVMETASFHESESKLTIAFGRDISGLPIVANLAKMPHLLVAGATGSGKSVCINGIIISILYKATPNEVKFLMIDPKMVELNVYNGIPHLLAPVVTDPRRASLALKKVVLEMEKRYEMFSKTGTRNLEGFNAMIRDNKGTPIPHIVVIVDELADLMMVAAGDVEDSICRLAQMARAAGIHLIIATQRPSVDVITGVIKANIPSRIAFGVSSQVDSRTILDMVGAEKLLGRGDMLFLPMGASKPVRVQGAFLSDQEVEAVVGFVSKQEKAEYQVELVPELDEQTDSELPQLDELFDQAVHIILEAKQASVSLLQRRMRIGYTRAARLIDTMEARGIVGPYEGSKPREVLVSIEQYQHNRMSS